jgi:hypothetical protein
MSRAINIAKKYPADCAMSNLAAWERPAEAAAAARSPFVGPGETNKPKLALENQSLSLLKVFEILSPHEKVAISFVLECSIVGF